MPYNSCVTLLERGADIKLKRQRDKHTKRDRQIEREIRSDVYFP